MKSSKYNYYVPYGEECVIFNGISESHFKVPLKRMDTYRNIIDNPDEYLEIYSDFLNKMYEEGFLNDDSVDERILLENKFNYLQRPQEYHLMILPTYQCNLRCWYCTQRHEETFISREVVTAIKRHISSQLKLEEIKGLRLSWFGGEPLLAYDTVREITKYAKDECLKVNKYFYSDITTNGTLLDKCKIKEFAACGINNYQITIDGVKAEHDKIKNGIEGSAFDKVMEVVNLLPGYSDCILRYNYTARNLRPREIIAELDAALSTAAKENIVLSICRVWQENDENICEESIKEIYRLSKEIGLSTSPDHNTGICYADRPGFNCVFPNGKVGKCDNHSMYAVPAQIDSNGGIMWPEGQEYTIPVFYRNGGECKECKYFPICWGPCPSKRKSMLKERNKIECPWNDKEKAFAEKIIRLTQY